MANVAVDENSLKAIGNALRERLGETTLGYVTEIQELPAVRYLMSANIVNLETVLGGYSSVDGFEPTTLTIEGADSLELFYKYELREGSISGADSNDFASGYNYVDTICITPEDKSETISLVNGYWANNDFNATVTGSSVTVRCVFYKEINSADSTKKGFYLEVRGLDADGNYITEPTEVLVPDKVPNKFYPADMADAVRSIVPNQVWRRYVGTSARNSEGIQEIDFSATGIDFEKGNHWMLCLGEDSSNPGLSGGYGYEMKFSPVFGLMMIGYSASVPEKYYKYSEFSVNPFGGGLSRTARNAWYDEVAVGVKKDSTYTLYPTKITKNTTTAFTMTLFYLDKEE